MEQMCTPQKTLNRSLTNSLVVPATPSMPCIGRGTGVSVYSMARSPLCGSHRSPWAIKKVNKIVKSCEYENRLVAEADVLRSLKHPNIVGFRAFVKTEEGKKCLAMEKCEISLGELIEERLSMTQDPFPVNSILTVAKDICEALHYLHDKCCILHGDVKSMNILIKGDFEVAKLCDFGVILQLDSTGTALPGQEYIGTECWWAPEVLDEKESKITSKSDIFSFGLTLWEMLSLRPPHTPIISSDTEMEDSISDDSFLDQVGTCPDMPENLGPEYAEVDYILHWCCEENYTIRPNARDVIQYLKYLSEK